MPFHQPDSLRYYTFDSLDEAGVIQAIYTRSGGVSPAPWNSLNMGGMVGDDPARVLENRRRAFADLGLSMESSYDVWQIHSAEVVSTEHARLRGVPLLKADAILTGKPGVALFMRFADCVPIFLYDPVRSVIGLVHAGWMGTVQKIVKASVQAMQRDYRSQPKDILATIGPSIGPDHYIIGSDVIDQVRSAFHWDADYLLQEKGEEVTLDLWGANRLILEEAGVRKIELSGICTACHLEDWFSHRGERGKTGRFGAILCLKG